MGAQAMVPDDLLTIEELSRRASLSVRTVRYYVSLGLMPPPVRHGRLAYYNERHLAVLQLVRALQDNGFKLEAIQHYLGRLPSEATPEDLAVQRVMLTPWSKATTETVTRMELDARVGRDLSDDEVDWLQSIRAVTSVGDDFELGTTFDVAAKLLDLEIPLSAVVAADEAIRRHMDTLADELTTVVRTQVLAPFRSEPHTEHEKVRFEHSLSELRQLTLEVLVAAFQRASDQTIARAVDHGRESAPNR